MTETAFSDLRTRVADALDDPSSGLLDGVAILPDVVDALSPPAFLLTWGNPWMVPATFCTHTVRLDVVCIAARIEPAPGVATLEEMVAVALHRLRAAGLPEATVQPPARYDVGGIPYLAARISIDARIAVPLPEVAPTSSAAASLVANAVLTATGFTSSAAIGAATLSVTATLTATGSTIAVPRTGTATLSTTGALSATGATSAWPVSTGAASLATTGALAATGSTSAAAPTPPVPGYVAWWDASDTSSITASGGLVSQIADKSGNGRHLIQVTGAKQPSTGVDTINGLNALKFGGDDCLTVASFPFGAFTTFVVYKLSGTAGMIYEHSANSYAGTAGQAMFGSSGGGINVRKASTSTNYDPVANWSTDGAAHVATHIYSGTHAAHDLLRDGVSIRGAVLLTADPGTTTTTDTLNVGARNNAAALPITGDLGEIVVYPSALNATDRRSVEAYLRTKWATPFSPASLPGLVAWYDASDLSTITASAGKVSQWSDKSGNGWHLAQGTGTAQPSTGTRTINGRNVLDFDGGDTLRNAAFTFPAVNTGTAFVVVSVDASAGNSGIFNMDINTADYFLATVYRWAAIDGTKFYTFSNNTQRASFTPRTIGSPVVLTSQRNGAADSMWRDGVAGSGTSGNPTTNFAPTGIAVGANRDSGVPVEYLDGAIAEVVLFSDAKNATDRAQVESYLRAKWGTP